MSTTEIRPSEQIVPGAANQVLSVNTSGTADEYRTLSGTTNQISVAFATGSITLSTPQNIATTSSPTFSSLTLSNPLTVANGGTGLSSTPSNGQLLIGNGTNYTLSTITGTTNEINVSNGSGSITLSTPQAIATSSSPTFAGLTITGSITATNQTITVQNIVITGVTSDPVSPVAGQFWYRSDTAQWVGWNGSNNVILG